MKTNRKLPNDHKSRNQKAAAILREIDSAELSAVVGGTTIERPVPNDCQVCGLVISLPVPK